MSRFARQPDDRDPPGSDEIARQLEPDRRYSLVRVGNAEYAFTSYDRYVAALKHVWREGQIPEALPSATGSRLLEVAPNLRAIDPDLDEA